MFSLSPTKRSGTPRRRPKTPGGALGAKLREQRTLAGASSLKSIAFPSDLPPSSPIPTSPRVDSDEQQVERMVVYSDFGSMQLEEDEEEEEPSDDLAQNDSDPFGFFAVERKLKTIRATNPLPQPDPDPSSEPQRMPSTPHKPKIGKTDFLSSASPSPIKLSAASAITSTPKPQTSTTSPTDASASSEPPRRSTRKRALVDKDVTAADKPTKRARSKPAATRSRAKPVVDAEEEDEEVFSDPPKGPPTRRSARVLATKAPSKPKLTKGKSVAKDKAKAKPVSKTKSKGKENTSDDEDDADIAQRERFAAERLARIEYFKQLDDYSFEKENVYVV